VGKSGLEILQILKYLKGPLEAGIFVMEILAKETQNLVMENLVIRILRVDN